MTAIWKGEGGTGTGGRSRSWVYNDEDDDGEYDEEEGGYGDDAAASPGGYPTRTQQHHSLSSTTGKEGLSRHGRRSKDRKPGLVNNYIGVSRAKCTKRSGGRSTRFCSRIKTGSRDVHLGTFDTEME
jgi:hypothetical protein